MRVPLPAARMTAVEVVVWLARVITATVRLSCASRGRSREGVRSGSGGSGVELAHLDSNKDKENQNLLCYRYTMGQRRCRSLLTAVLDLILRGSGVRLPSRGGGTLVRSVVPCVLGQHRVGSTDDGHARRGVGRPSWGPLPRLSSGLERLLAAPRRTLRCRRPRPVPAIVRHRRPFVEGSRDYPKSLKSQASVRGLSRGVLA